MKRAAGSQAEPAEKTCLDARTHAAGMSLSRPTVAATPCCGPEVVMKSKGNLLAASSLAEASLTSMEEKPNK